MSGVDCMYSWSNDISLSTSGTWEVRCFSIWNLEEGRDWCMGKAGFLIALWARVSGQNQDCSEIEQDKWWNGARKEKQPALQKLVIMDLGRSIISYSTYRPFYLNLLIPFIPSQNSYENEGRVCDCHYRLGIITGVAQDRRQPIHCVMKVYSWQEIIYIRDTWMAWREMSCVWSCVVESYPTLLFAQLPLREWIKMGVNCSPRRIIQTILNIYNSVWKWVSNSLDLLRNLSKCGYKIKFPVQFEIITTKSYAVNMTSENIYANI